MYVCMYVCIYTYTHLSPVLSYRSVLYGFVEKSISNHMYMYAHVCTNRHICIYIYTHIYIHAPKPRVVVSQSLVGLR